MCCLFFFVQKSLTNEGIVAYIYQYKKRELRLIVPSYFFLMVIRLFRKKVVPLHTKSINEYTMTKKKAPKKVW